MMNHNLSNTPASPVKGYLDWQTCLDGQDSHDFQDKTIYEEGNALNIKHCAKCGFWG